MIGQHTEKALLRRAEEVMIEKARTSEIFDVEAEQLLPRFKRSGEPSHCLFFCVSVFFISSFVCTIPKYLMNSNRN
jgi:hypothetical protein